MTIHVAHFSDLHYAAATLTEVDRCFSNAIDSALAQNVDLAVISGDATDHSLDVHDPAVDALLRQVRRLSDHCPVLMLQGTFSHEPPGTLKILRHMQGRHPVYVADRIEQVAILADGRWLPDRLWSKGPPAGTRAVFTCLPTVSKAVVAGHVPPADAAKAIGEQIATVLFHFGAANSEVRARGIPTIGVSHGTVHGCVTEHGVPMAGFDHEFTSATLFGAQASAFMLGHIHRHQAWQEGDRMIAYAGSIGRLHYGEEGEKGFLLWKVDAAGANAVLVPTPARRTLDIVFDGPPNMAELAEQVAQADIEGAFVRLRWAVAAEDRHLVDRAAIERILAPAAQSKLEGRIIGVQRARAPGIASEQSIEAKLARWAALVQADPLPLSLRLQSLHELEPEEIVETILSDPPPAVAQAALLVA